MCSVSMFMFIVELFCFDLHYLHSMAVVITIGIVCTLTATATATVVVDAAALLAHFLSFAFPLLSGGV